MSTTRATVCERSQTVASHVGGSSARDPLEGEGAQRIAEATHALRLDVERIGDDVLLSARIREW